MSLTHKPTSSQNTTTRTFRCTALSWCQKLLFKTVYIYIYIYLKKQSLHDGWHRLCIIPAPLKPPDVKQEGPGGQDNLVFVNTQAGTMTTKNTNDNDDNEVDFEKRTNVLRAENWLSAASYRQLHPFQRLHLYLNTRTPPAATQNNTFYPLSASFSFI